VKVGYAGPGATGVVTTGVPNEFFTCCDNLPNKSATPTVITMMPRITAPAIPPMMSQMRDWDEAGRAAGRGAGSDDEAGSLERGFGSDAGSLARGGGRELEAAGGGRGSGVARGGGSEGDGFGSSSDFRGGGRAISSEGRGAGQFRIELIRERDRRCAVGPKVGSGKDGRLSVPARAKPRSAGTPPPSRRSRWGRTGSRAGREEQSSSSDNRGLPKRTPRSKAASTRAVPCPPRPRCSKARPAESRLGGS